MVEIRVDPTPNPNSLKFTLNQPVLASGSFSATNDTEAEGNELAKALFSLGSVTNVFMINTFVSVNKSADASWNELQPKIESLLQEHYGG